MLHYLSISDYKKLTNQTKIKIMKRTFIITLLVLTATAGFAQGPPGPPPVDEEKIEALRIAFLTRYLDLSSEEAQKFWPVYNKMQDELKVVLDKEKDLRNGKKIDDMTDEELTKMIAAHFENEQKILDIKKKYAEEFKKVLSLKKVALLADAENEFKREMLKHARDKQGPPGGGEGDRPGGRYPGPKPGPDRP